MVQPKEYWHGYYERNKRALKRSAKTVYYARTGTTVFWIRPPNNYIDFCNSNNITPQLF